MMDKGISLRPRRLPSEAFLVTFLASKKVTIHWEESKEKIGDSQLVTGELIIKNEELGNRFLR